MMFAELLIETNNDKMVSIWTILNKQYNPKILVIMDDQIHKLVLPDDVVALILLIMFIMIIVKMLLFLIFGMIYLCVK